MIKRCPNDPSARLHFLGWPWAALALVLVAACVPQGKYDKALKDGEVVQGKLSICERQAKALAADLAKLDAKQKATDARAQKLDTDLQASKKRLDDLLAENQALRAELERLGKSADQLLSEKGALSESLATTRAQLEQLRLAQKKAEERARLFRDLALKFQKMIDAGKLRVVLRDGRMVLQLSNDVLFDSGRTEIKKGGKEALKEVAGVLRTIRDRHFQVAGHTDNVPIHTAQFPTNWELSTARALRVVHFLVQEKMDPKMLSAAGYAKFDPVASNTSKDGKAKNRRTEITLMPNIDELIAVPQQH